MNHESRTGGFQGLVEEAPKHAGDVEAFAKRVRLSGIPEVARDEEEILQLFRRPFAHVVEPRFVPGVATPETLGNVRADGDRRPSGLARQSVALVGGIALRDPVNPRNPLFSRREISSMSENSRDSVSVILDS